MGAPSPTPENRLDAQHHVSDSSSSSAGLPKTASEERSSRPRASPLWFCYEITPAVAILATLPNFPAPRKKILSLFPRYLME
jgi:hypothetical protein